MASSRDGLSRAIASANRARGTSAGINACRAGGSNVAAAVASSAATTNHPGTCHPGKKAAAAFEYQPAYLPVNRLSDGAVHDW